ncbi:MAG: MFS transporter [Candidatus Promineifilaceae bacterium]|jgi:GPH family glycoside/pentoside/hexuronide:cation symporter
MAKANQKLSKRFKTLFGTGDLTTNSYQAVILFYQLYFLTDVAGLRPGLAAWAIAIGRIWDAVNDPLFGLISDRIKSPLGRRRVVLLFGAVPLGLSFMLMWVVPDISEAYRAAYYALAFILFDTCYTAVHVSYNALTPVVTKDYDERSSVNGYRMIFGLGGSLGAIILATILAGRVADQQELFLWLGIGLGLLNMIPPLIVFFITKDYRSQPESSPLSPRASIGETIKNSAFQKLMGLYLFSWTTASIMAAVLIYYANYYLRKPDWANYYVLAAQGAAILFIPLVVFMAQKLDKRRAFVVNCSWWILLLLILFFVQPDQAGLVFLLAALAGLGIATVYVIPWAMIPDIIEDDELRTGRRREGTYYALVSFFQKLGTGAALWAMGQVFEASGYITPVLGQPLPAQPASAVLAIRLFMSLIPAALLVIAVFFALQYPISREKHRAMLAELELNN